MSADCYLYFSISSFFIYGQPRLLPRRLVFSRLRLYYSSRFVSLTTVLLWSLSVQQYQATSIQTRSASGHYSPSLYCASSQHLSFKKRNPAPVNRITAAEFHLEPKYGRGALFSQLKRNPDVHFLKSQFFTFKILIYLESRRPFIDVGFRFPMLHFLVKVGFGIWNLDVQLWARYFALQIVLFNSYIYSTIGHIEFLISGWSNICCWCSVAEPPSEIKWWGILFSDLAFFHWR